MVAGAGVTTGAIEDPQGSLALSSGSLTLTDPGTPSTAGGFQETGGPLTGAGALGVAGSFGWSGGMMSGSGETVLAAGSVGVINPPGYYGYVQLSVRTLVNEGSLTFSSGNIFGYSAAQILNSGTFYLNSEAT